MSVMIGKKICFFLKKKKQTLYLLLIWFLICFNFKYHYSPVFDGIYEFSQIAAGGSVGKKK